MTVGRINGDARRAGQPADPLPAPVLSRARRWRRCTSPPTSMLVTSLRDGMNLVAKEYVACRFEETGALVLSEFTGAADELGGGVPRQPARHRRAQGGHRPGGEGLASRGAAPDAVDAQAGPRARRVPMGRRLPGRPQPAVTRMNAACIHISVDERRVHPGENGGRGSQGGLTGLGPCLDPTESRSRGYRIAAQPSPGGRSSASPSASQSCSSR